MSTRKIALSLVENQLLFPWKPLRREGSALHSVWSL